MAQIFPRWTNLIPYAAPPVLGIGTVVAVFAVWYWFSPYFTDVGYQPDQPVEYSHKLHAGDMGMDCRYCHNTVEMHARGAVPPTDTCMNCHLIIKGDSPKLELIRTANAASAQAVEAGKAPPAGSAVEWVRIHQLPDYAFFNHSAHLSAGVGCTNCHGRVDLMDKVEMAEPLSMGWCLDCHFGVKDHIAAGGGEQPWLRPLDRITDMDYDPVAEGYDPLNDPHRARPASDLKPPIHCSGCHR